MSRSFIVILGEIDSIDYYAVLVQNHCFLLLMKSYIGNNCQGMVYMTPGRLSRWRYFHLGSCTLARISLKCHVDAK